MRLALLLFMLALTASLARAYPLSHDISDTAGAQAEAKERGLPIAYLGVIPGFLDQPSPVYNSDAELSKMALNALQSRAVVITFDGRNMAPVPWFVHWQYHQQDDGPLDGGAAWIVPKIVFTDPGITKILGRVSHTQMAAGREGPIENALDAINNDPHALDPKPKHLPPPVAVSDDTQASDSDEGPKFGTLGWGINLIADRWQFFVAGFAIFIVALITWAARNL